MLGHDKSNKSLAKSTICSTYLGTTMQYFSVHEHCGRHVKRASHTSTNYLHGFFLDPVLGTIALPCEEGRDHLWCKVRAAFKYVYEHHLNEADFFLKADDDSYMIVENLRYLLEGYTGDDPVHFGSKFLLPNRHDQVSLRGGQQVLDTTLNKY